MREPAKHIQWPGGPMGSQIYRTKQENGLDSRMRVDRSDHLFSKKLSTGMRLIGTYVDPQRKPIYVLSPCGQNAVLRFILPPELFCDTGTYIYSQRTWPTHSSQNAILPIISWLELFHPRKYVDPQQNASILSHDVLDCRVYTDRYCSIESICLVVGVRLQPS